MKFIALFLFLMLSNPLHSKDVSTSENGAPLVKNEMLFYDLGLNGGWIPYQEGSQAGSSGVFEDVIALIAKHSGLKFKTVNFPPRRAKKALETGLVDFDFISPSWFDKPIDPKLYVLTQPLFDVSEYFITRTDKNITLPGEHDYFGMNIGTVAGYIYKNSDKFTRVDLLNENKLIIGLKNDRFDIAILEREAAKHWAKVNGVKIEFPLLHTHGFLHIRLRADKSHHLVSINKAISLIKENGELQAVFDAHHLNSKFYPDVP